MNPHVVGQIRTDAFAAVCNTSAYLGRTYNIINLNAQQTSYLDRLNSSTAEIIPFMPGSMNATPDVWQYNLLPSNLTASGPLNKPLYVDCPIQACGFAVSGPYCDLQRYLVYANVLFSLVAHALPILRGISTAWLVTTGFSSFVHLCAMAALHRSPWSWLSTPPGGSPSSSSSSSSPPPPPSLPPSSNFVDLDAEPAAVYTCAGLAAVVLWCSLRAAPFRPTAASASSSLDASSSGDSNSDASSSSRPHASSPSSASSSPCRHSRQTSIADDHDDGGPLPFRARRLQQLYYPFFGTAAFILVATLLVATGGVFAAASGSGLTSMAHQHFLRAVLLEGPDAYWLTSVCRANGSTGNFVAWWTAPDEHGGKRLDYGIRSPGELRVLDILVDDARRNWTELLARGPATTAVDEFVRVAQNRLQGVNTTVFTWGLMGFGVGGMLISLTRACLKDRHISRLIGRAEVARRKDGRAVQILFLFVVGFQALPSAVAFVVLVVYYELQAYAYDIPMSEDKVQYGQWSGCIIAALAILGVLFVKLAGFEEGIAPAEKERSNNKDTKEEERDSDVELASLQHDSEPNSSTRRLMDRSNAV